MGQRDQKFEKCKELIAYLNGWGYAVNVKTILQFISGYEGDWPESVVQLEQEYHWWQQQNSLIPPIRNQNNE